MPEERSENFFTELLKFIVIAAIIVIPIRFFVAQPFIVSGASMDPTFENGQYLIVDELSYHLDDPKRGDVVIFRYPKSPDQYFIKRVIGLPGETVYVDPNGVSVKEVDGDIIPLKEPYVVNPGNGSTASFTVGEGQYFVMGDNRPESSDSRAWGLLPRGDIVGRAFVRLLPFSTAGLLPGSVHYTQ